MVGLGTLINTAAIIGGGLVGMTCGRQLKQRVRETINQACGISVLFIGIAGAMEGMLRFKDGALTGTGSVLITVCLALGALLGEWIDIQGLFVRFGEWLKKKTGNAKDPTFVGAFVTASLTVCIGAMAVVGSVKDGMSGDWSVLAAKSVLDLLIIMVMTVSLGKGCVFSAIPVFLCEGTMTLLASLLSPFMTEAALADLSMVGSILIFCVGVNLVWDKSIRVANLLPALVLAAAASALPL